MLSRFQLSLILCLFTGTLSANTDLPQPDIQRAQKIHQLLQQFHYHPAELKLGAYQSIKQQIELLDASTPNPAEFAKAFNTLWQDGPFSHVRLAKRQQSVEEIAAYLDTMNVGEQGATLTWQGRIAVLTVTTMMGLDTIEQINSAYQQLTNAKALVIDLRLNEGGAFAVRPLVAHLLNHPLTAGAFASRLWFNSHHRQPISSDWQALPPWHGWSIRSFWQDVQAQPLTKIEFSPEAPYYAGPVYLLVSGKTASAAELAAAALATLPNVTLVGENTAGEMLSQTLFDLNDDSQLFLPIADYFSSNLGRIEGRGIEPDIKINADQALQHALTLAAQH